MNSNNSMESTPTLVITSGEPSGIGPEVSLKALTHQSLNARCLVLGDQDLLQQTAKAAKLSAQIIPVTHVDEVPKHNPEHIYVLHHPLSSPNIPGELNVDNASYVLGLLKHAHQLAMSGDVDGIVTAPVHKGIINDAGEAFTGHTEFFAQHSGKDKVVMMLACDAMRVALVTTHHPLKDVAQRVTQGEVELVIKLCVEGLQQLGIKTPNIKVCGLNPHAGEGGHLGDEEQRFITPALQNLQHLPANISGPFPADTLFNQQTLKNTDLFLGMYHDQVLPVIKFASFGQCANVTLGLPYLRTSVDHGTALNIAASYQADAGSMEYALKYAIQACQSLS
ncbi:4-hydroxythreonine-4-phosphate dehydrogenase PdxA [Pleionea sp. CnH1-48]|uniref:4-hydroxythreonine-4-phosphate dehydrogenase PdxA n=1 Tax=Pleionea sp. CnH1-48 TaxID=2954494 RepID=UPI002096F110|nr:4-hydroxythreonine-4-phosphate dehydrogenase PdxA [Pleionea sp. CnH1-48]MCO7224440.1 4-hydroxythreonine-4-phosphate dehydrogenase PdxA [Pleionea sp. CnH1-48]